VALYLLSIILVAHINQVKFSHNPVVSLLIMNTANAVLFDNTDKLELCNLAVPATMFSLPWQSDSGQKVS
jgi:hypothetical protein